MSTLKPKILCVDDEPDLLDINSTILRSAGYVVFKASTGNECLRIAIEEKPDLILLDVVLPDINGVDISKQIKTNPAFEGTYVILISGQRTSSDSKVEGLEAGADGYIVRPVSKHELLARVQAIMRIKETEMALRKSRERYQMLVVAMNEGLGIVDENAVNTFVNKKLCEILGRSQDEIIGHPLTDFIAEDNQKLYKEQLAKREKGISIPYELVLTKKDGQKVFTTVSPKPIFDENGKFNGSFAVVTDITERKKAEDEIKRLNEELEQRVVERTSELEAANKALHVEITERKQVEEKLKRYAEHLQTLSKRLLEIQEAERRYIAQELHDEIGQDLTGIKLALEMIIEYPSENRETRLFEMQKMVHELLSKVRAISLDLRPSMLDDLGLLPALLWHFERYTQKTNIKVHFTHSGLNVRFKPEIETASYRIVQEALTNIARYAHVNEAAVIIKEIQEMLVINIEDKGVGFDHEVIKASGNTAGLRWMHERIAMLGGKMLVESAPGKGTRLTAEIPLRRTTP